MSSLIISNHLPDYMGISALIIMTPGPDTALTVRNTLRGGRRGGVLTALGVAVGQVIWSIATSAGLATVLLTVRPAFTVVQLLGASYLLFLGAQALRDGLRSPVPTVGPILRHVDTRIEKLTSLRQGVLSNLGNPKMAVFFTSLLPQFAPHDHPSFFSLAALGLIFCCITLGWLSGYAVIVARAGEILQRPVLRRALDAATGTILIGLGFRLATERF
jgi:threonine/homoserine/homoserine lactone efflux protein